MVSGATTATAAKKPIPGIKETASFKSLKSYSDNLQVRQETGNPLAEAQRIEFQQELDRHKQAADKTVKSLFAWRQQRIVGTRKASSKLVQKRANQKASKQLRQAAAQNKRDLSKSKSQYQSRINNIDRSFAPSIGKLNRDITALKSKLNKTKHPGKVVALQDKINEKTILLDNLISDRDTERKDVNRDYRKALASDKKLYSNRLKRVESRRKSDLAVGRVAVGETFSAQTAKNKSNRGSSFQLVALEKLRGQEALDATPAPPVIPEP